MNARAVDSGKCAAVPGHVKAEALAAMASRLTDRKDGMGRDSWSVRWKLLEDDETGHVLRRNNG